MTEPEKRDSAWARVQSFPAAWNAYQHLSSPEASTPPPVTTTSIPRTSHHLRSGSPNVNLACSRSVLWPNRPYDSATAPGIPPLVTTPPNPAQVHIVQHAHEALGISSIWSEYS